MNATVIVSLALYISIIGSASSAQSPSQITNAPSAEMHLLVPGSNAVINLRVNTAGESKNQAVEIIQAIAPYLATLIALGAVVVTFYQARLQARVQYSAEILKFRLRQVQDFYAPALLLADQSLLVSRKLKWTIKKLDPKFDLSDFRLLDHIHKFQSNPNLKPLIDRILAIGKKLTGLISAKSGLIEGGLTPTFISYQAHFSILDAAMKQELTAIEKDGWHEEGYYPRILNREIREGFKLVLAHLENYLAAGDKMICSLLKVKPVELGKYRRQLIENLSYYEKHAKRYAAKFDAFDLSEIRERFSRAIEATRSLRPPAFADEKITVLDVGCGTGRDTLAFVNKGYVVEPVDASPAMLREVRTKLENIAADETKKQLQGLAEESLKRYSEKAFDELQYRNEFDGVWAAASLLHVPTQQMQEIVKKLLQALKPNGVLFMSFKYGHGEHEHDARHYTYYDRKSIRRLLGGVPAEQMESWLTDGSGKKLSWLKQKWAWTAEYIGRHDRSLWLNVMLRRRST